MGNSIEKTSLERVLDAINHKESDRVPLMLLLSIYGAKESKIPIKEYFSKSENVVKAQLKMMKKYRNDCLYTFSYAPVEIEAFGGEVIFVEDGPPNSGEPIIKNLDKFLSQELPQINESKCLLRVLETTANLKQSVGNTVPIIGMVMSPFSIPVMQMGFERYLELIYYRRAEFDKLMQKNIEFCILWANAQLKAGATAICYFDPLASPTIIERETYLKTGFEIAKKTISAIEGPVATHLASGAALPVIDDIVATKSAIVGFGGDDNLEQIKRASSNKICLLGNLNGIEMASWTPQIAEDKVKELILGAGKNGGLIVSDGHGEIPYQVSEDVLMAISEAVKKWGQYPLKWSDDRDEA